MTRFYFFDILFVLMLKRTEKLNQEIKEQSKEEAVISAVNNENEGKDKILISESQEKKLISKNEESDAINQQEIKEKLEAEQNKLDEAEQKVSKGNQKKKKIMNLVFFLINIAVVAGILAYQLTKENFVSLEGLGLRGEMILVLLLVFSLTNILDMSGMSYLIQKDTSRYQFALSMKTLLMGRYYDSITPLAIGGQPFQVAYLKKHDVSTSASISIPVAKMVFNQFAFFVLSLIALIVSSLDSSVGAFAQISSIIGFIASFSFLFLIIFLSISKNIGKKLVVKILKFLQKIKIIKNYEKVYQKVSRIVEDYQVILSNYMKNPKDFVIMFFLSLFKGICQYSLPFIIYTCFFTGGTFELYFRFFVCGVLIDLASSFIPLPGGTGMSELTFGALFGNFFAGGRLFWAIIFWRMATYYIYLLLGVVIMSYDVSYGNRKFKWKKKERELQAESLTFKQLQIQKFRKDRAKRRKKEMKSE